MNYSRCLRGLAAALLGFGSTLFAQHSVMSPGQPGPYGAPMPYGAPYGAPAGDLAPHPGTDGASGVGSADGTLPHPMTPASTSVTSWLGYPRGPLCCDTVGGHGPIMGETYGRWGVAIPIGGNAFTSEMNTGFSFEIGARTLFFNPTVDRAWTVSFGLESTWNSITNGPSFPLIGESITSINIFGQPETQFIPVQNVTPARLHTTTLNIAIGHEKYLWGSALCDGMSKFRVGWDIGGRVGKAKLDFLVEKNRTDTVGGFFLATHADYECPLNGCCTFYLGGRVSYGYTWSDILQSQNNTDFQLIGVYVTTGVRF